MVDSGDLLFTSLNTEHSSPKLKGKNLRNDHKLVKVNNLCVKKKIISDQIRVRKSAISGLTRPISTS